jgi:hypothetical protein
MWTSFDTLDELRKYIDGLIERLHYGDKDVLDEICGVFPPTSTFKELSMQNGWSDESEFDKISERLR